MDIHIYVYLQMPPTPPIQIRRRRKEDATRLLFGRYLVVLKRPKCTSSKHPTYFHTSLGALFIRQDVVVGQLIWSLVVSKEFPDTRFSIREQLACFQKSTRNPTHVLPVINPIAPRPHCLLLMLSPQSIHVPVQPDLYSKITLP